MDTQFSDTLIDWGLPNGDIQIHYFFSIVWNILKYWLKHPLIDYLVTLKYNLHKEFQEEMFNFILYLSILK